MLKSITVPVTARPTIGGCFGGSRSAGFLGGSDGEESPWNAEDPGSLPWRSKCLHTPVFLPGELHEQRSLVGYSPWGHKEWDTAERLTHFHPHAARGTSPTKDWTMAAAGEAWNFSHWTSRKVPTDASGTLGSNQRTSTGFNRHEVVNPHISSETWILHRVGVVNQRGMRRCMFKQTVIWGTSSWDWRANSGWPLSCGQSRC